MLKESMATSGTLIVLLIILVFFYGTVEHAGRRLGCVFMLLGRLGALYMSFLHGMGPRATRWGFFVVWTMLTLGVTRIHVDSLGARTVALVSLTRGSSDYGRRMTNSGYWRT